MLVEKCWKGEKFKIYFAGLVQDPQTWSWDKPLKADSIRDMNLSSKNYPQYISGASLTLLKNRMSKGFQRFVQHHVLGRICAGPLHKWHDHFQSFSRLTLTACCWGSTSKRPCFSKAAPTFLRNHTIHLSFSEQTFEENLSWEMRKSSESLGSFKFGSSKKAQGLGTSWLQNKLRYIWR